MTIKVFIERKFKDDLSLEEVRTINELRIGAMHRKGYVSGETLIDLKDHRRIVVLSVWSNWDGWKAWKNSKERSKLEAKFNINLKQAPIVRAFMLGPDYLGGIFEEVDNDAEVPS